VSERILHTCFNIFAKAEPTPSLPFLKGVSLIFLPFLKGEDKGGVCFSFRVILVKLQSNYFLRGFG